MDRTFSAADGLGWAEARIDLGAVGGGVQHSHVAWLGVFTPPRSSDGTLGTLHGYTLCDFLSLPFIFSKELNGNTL